MNNIPKFVGSIETEWSFNTLAQQFEVKIIFHLKDDKRLFGKEKVIDATIQLWNKEENGFRMNYWFLTGEDVDELEARACSFINEQVKKIRKTYRENVRKEHSLPTDKTFDIEV